ncbi:MAG: LPS export ABC transporter permease LptG [Rubricella sp.]
MTGWTLSLYLARRLLTAIGLAFLATLFIIVLGDIVELSREAASRGTEDLPLLSMALLHAPNVMNRALPYVMLIGGLAAFLRLARSSELVVMRAAGLSAWRILTVPVLLALVLGTLTVTVYNPVAAAALKRYESLEIKYFRGQDSLLDVSREGLWLRQPNDRGHAVINARRASGDGIALVGVTVFEFDDAGDLVQRIEASEARLTDGAWVFEEAQLWSVDAGNVARTATDRVDLPTDLTPERILESFADPRSLSFWDLDAFIATLDASGFSSVRHRLHQQVEISKPVLFVAMLLIGAGFSMRHARFGRTGQMVLMAVATGFGVFFLMDIAQALGAAGNVPLVVAAWAPPFATLFFGVFLLLSLEDG